MDKPPPFTWFVPAMWRKWRSFTATQRVLIVTAVGFAVALFSAGQLN